MQASYKINKNEQTWTTQLFCRTLYAEETLEKTTKNEVKQFVILGAGLDTFAFRRAYVE
jgi:O-methyltransferase involved in polyketide biosynthesis